MNYDFNDTNTKNEALEGYWNQWPWEWFFTARIKNHHYGLLLKRFRVALQKDEHLQIAYVGVYVSFPHPHLHILMLGKSKNGKRLAEVDSSHWEKQLQDITHNTVIIENIYDQEGVVSYMVRYNMPAHRHEALVPYNKKLLKRMKVNGLLSQTH